MTLKARWIDFLVRAATGSRRFRNVFTPVGAVFFGLLVLSFVVLSLQADRLIGLEDLFPDRLSVLLSLPLFIFLNAWELKAVEEPELVKRLGQAYVEYRRRTPMFFPKIGGNPHRRS